MSDVLLESRWGDTKDALLEGLEGNRRNSMSVVLENTRKYLKEAASTGASASGNIATLNRVISVREMARLQTFPDNFFFEGTMKRGMWQVGNAVPVKLSEHLGLAIKSLL